jgi:trehalose 6-phosphate synthase/phosphatase
MRPEHRNNTRTPELTEVHDRVGCVESDSGTVPRLIIVSNRLPFSVTFVDAELRLDSVAGGLATGLSALLDSYKGHLPKRDNHLWVGWPGATVAESHREVLRQRALREHSAFPVFLSQDDMEKFYRGFCNSTIWPLFHYFPSFVAYREEYWEQYVKVNELFCDALAEVVREGDLIWIQDYHLML